MAVATWFASAMYSEVKSDARRIRGILCTPCNTGLGMFKDNPTIIRSAIRYLKRA